MSENRNENLMSRRRALGIAGGATAGLLVVPTLGSAKGRRLRGQHGHLPVKSIQDAVGAEGDVSSGVLGIPIDREDVGEVKGPHGIPFKTGFETGGDLTFQPLGHRLAFFNGDLALKPSELNPVIDAILAGGLTFQAFHQHYFDLDPMLWFIHFRGVGEPVALAQRVHRVLKATSTPLPQKKPTKPATPLNVKRLEKILHGTATVGAKGVVTVSVPRSDRIVIGDVIVSPEANISTNIAFEPLDAKGPRAAAAPDFSMRTSEVAPVIRTMRREGFEVHCLYNQESGESPQLYFAHMIASGDAYALAGKIRAGLNHTHSK